MEHSHQHHMAGQHHQKHNHGQEPHAHHRDKHMNDTGHGSAMHDKHAGHDVAGFWKRFIICSIVSFPVLALSHMIQLWLGFEFAFPGDKYVLAILATFVFFYGGYPFLKGLFDEVRDHAIGMMALIGVAITVAWAYSVAITFGLAGMDFYWEMATLIDIMLIGHWLEMRSVLGASNALQLLVKMMPSVAHKVHGEHLMDIRVEELKSGDTILVKPGEKVPADGIVTDGESYLDESMLTGESKPVKKEKNQKVIGGSVNGNGSMKVKVEHTGKESYLKKVIKMVEEAQQSKSRMQNLSDRAAKWLTYIALSAGAVTLAAWLAYGHPFEYALERMVTVMVISCPHALGLAVPLVVAISTALSAQHGLLIRNRTAFEESRKISAIVFDKTGTLTKGVFGVTRIKPLSDLYTEKEVLRMAAALEQHSEHPIAVGIVKKARSNATDIPGPENFKAITGKGVEAKVEGKDVKVVSPGYLREANLPVPPDAYTSEAETVVFVLINDALAGFIALADEVRPESAGAIRKFRENGIRVYMATGDNEKVAKAVSSQLNLEGYFAEVLPHRKVEIVKELQAKGEFVAMTGDGVNDAPALAQADVGIAVGSGTDIAAETADIILVNSNPKDILNLILFGRATYRKMIQNLAWATGYNAFAIPLAAGALYAWGIVLSPALGAVLMSLSTIIVAINAKMLKV